MPPDTPLNAFQNTFAGNPLDRASEHRKDVAWLADRLASDQSLGLVLWNGRALVERSSSGGAQIAYLPSRLVEDLSGGPERLLFMGLWKDTAVFAVDLEGSADPTDGPLQGMGRFEDARTLASSLPPGEIAIVGTAKGVFEWRRRHRACSVCGEPTQVVEGGWKRECPACGAEHFPRTDPVVIMLAVHGNRCMLGRQEIWPPGMFSALAGFLEPGESIEEAIGDQPISLPTVVVKLAKSGLTSRNFQASYGDTLRINEAGAPAVLIDLDNVRELTKLSWNGRPSARWFHQARRALAEAKWGRPEALAELPSPPFAEDPGHILNLLDRMTPEDISFAVALLIRRGQA